MAELNIVDSRGGLPFNDFVINLAGITLTLLFFAGLFIMVGSLISLSGIVIVNVNE